MILFVSSQDGECLLGVFKREIGVIGADETLDKKKGTLQRHG